MIRYARSTALAAFVLLCSCCGSSPGGDDWLITLGDDTITVKDAGVVWDGLEDPERQQFLRSEDPAASFVVSLAHLELVIREIERLGYLDRPEATLPARAWVRRALYETAVDSARSMVERQVSREDIQFFRSLMGRTVWYTLWPDGTGAEHGGPVHLPELPEDVALCLDTLRPGQSAVCGDATIRLDSVYATDPDLVAQTLRDTSRVESLARNRLSEVRYSMLRDSLLESSLGSARIDTSALEAMASSVDAGHFRPDTGAVVISGPVESWTERKLLVEVYFVSESRPVDPSNTTWLLFLTKNLLLQNAFVSWLKGRTPGIPAAVIAAGESQRFNRALDLIYSEMVAESVRVSPRELEECYASLSEPVMMPERRRLELVVFPEQELSAFREVTVDSESSPADVFDPYPWYRDTTRAGCFTVPLERSQLPSTFADSAFSVAPGDTTQWRGPFVVPRLELMAAFRLCSVIPPREATLEEATDILSSLIRTEKVQNRLGQWMSRLENSYGLSVNDAILDRLPPDPALWSEL